MTEPVDAGSFCCDGGSVGHVTDTSFATLAAGEAIFARDGFEAARLEDIAAEAGYTRGAFYANFESKEDIFFALLEMWVAERMEEVDALIEKKTRTAGRRAPRWWPTRWGRSLLMTW